MEKCHPIISKSQHCVFFKQFWKHTGAVYIIKPFCTESDWLGQLMYRPGFGLSYAEEAEI